MGGEGLGGKQARGFQRRAVWLLHTAVWGGGGRAGQSGQDSLPQWWRVSIPGIRTRPTPPYSAAPPPPLTNTHTGARAHTPAHARTHGRRFDGGEVHYRDIMPGAASAAASEPGSPPRGGAARPPPAPTSPGTGPGTFLEVPLKRRSLQQRAYSLKLRVFTADKLNAGLGGSTVCGRGRRGRGRGLCVFACRGSRGSVQRARHVCVCVHCTCNTCCSSPTAYGAP